MNKQKPNLTISDEAHSTLNTLIEANFLNLSNAATAELLQQRGIKTVTGKDYTRQSIENMLFKFRYPGNSHSTMFKSLMTAISAGLISLSDAGSLVAPRPRGRSYA